MTLSDLTATEVTIHVASLSHSGGLNDLPYFA